MNRALEAVAKAWQLPISSQGRNKETMRAHWFERSSSCWRLVRAACGRWFNPGFAVLAPRGMKRCEKCKERE